MRNGDAWPPQITVQFWAFSEGRGTLVLALYHWAIPLSPVWRFGMWQRVCDRSFCEENLQDFLKLRPHVKCHGEAQWHMSTPRPCAAKWEASLSELPCQLCKFCVYWARKNSPLNHSSPYLSNQKRKTNQATMSYSSGRLELWLTKGGHWHPRQPWNIVIKVFVITLCKTIHINDTGTNKTTICNKDLLYC